MEGVVMRVATRSGLKHDLDAAMKTQPSWG